MVLLNSLFPLVSLLLLLPTPAQSARTALCNHILLYHQLSSGYEFKKAIGEDLVFKVDPERSDQKGGFDGWFISLVSSREPDDDYLYPVNPPLRLNPLQTLGPGYGEDAKASLAYIHEMRFVLTAADYRQIWPFVTNALWPYNAPDPDKADDEYFGALKKLTTGLLRITVTSYDLDGPGRIRQMKFRAEFWAPVSFSFDPTLKAKQTECPASKD
jgi:hypothetical protein